MRLSSLNKWQKALLEIIVKTADEDPSGEMSFVFKEMSHYLSEVTSTSKLIDAHLLTLQLRDKGLIRILSISALHALVAPLVSLEEMEPLGSPDILGNISVCDEHKVDKQESLSCAILYFDTVESSLIKYGDLKATISQFISSIINEISEKFVFLYKNDTGDGYVILGKSIVEISEAALIIRDKYRHKNWLIEGFEKPVKVRVGLHYGIVNVTKSDGSIKKAFSSSLDLGKRIESVAAPNNVVCTKVFYDNLIASLASDHIVGDPLGKKTLPKNSGEEELYNIRFKSDELLKSSIMQDVPMARDTQIKKKNETNIAQPAQSEKMPKIPTVTDRDVSSPPAKSSSSMVIVTAIIGVVLIAGIILVGVFLRGQPLSNSSAPSTPVSQPVVNPRPKPRPVPPDPDARGRWPWTSDRPVATNDLQGLSLWDLFIMRNEIYARHGRVFVRESLINYFKAQPWYSPQPGKKDAQIAAEMSAIEKKNGEKIKNYAISKYGKASP